MRLDVLPGVALAGAAVALAALGGTVASAAPTASLSVRVSPAKAGTATRPRGVGFGISVSARSDPGSAPSQPTRSLLRFQRGFRFNSARFPTCSKAALDAGGPERCGRARIGSGDADIDAGLFGSFRADIQIFNGVRRGSSPTVLLRAVAAGQTRTLVGVLRNQPTGPFGYVLDVEIPPMQTIPGQPPAALARMAITVPDRAVRRRIRTRRGRRTRTYHLIEAPRSCAGSWQFEGQLLLASGESITATDSVACSR